jgi:hypothetical protein
VVWTILRENFDSITVLEEEEEVVEKVAIYPNSPTLMAGSRPQI